MENKDLESLSHTHTHTLRYTPYLFAALVQMEIFKALPAQAQPLLQPASASASYLQWKTVCGPDFPSSQSDALEIKAPAGSSGSQNP